jgi:Na+/H+ antiporter NhaD/arsenite permease-like protein
MTMIGSTANIVALGVLEKKTGHLIKLGYWLKVGLLASLIPMAIGMGAIMISG